MPRVLHIILLLIAWAAVPLAGASVTGIWNLSDKAEMVVFGGTALGVISGLVLYIARRMDELARARQAAEQKADLLIIAVNRLSEGVTVPQPVLHVVPPQGRSREAARRAGPHRPA